MKTLNEPARALEHYEILFKRSPSAVLAYELADLKIQTDDLTGASLNITYGMANSTTDMMKAYYEAQTPYQVSLVAGFVYFWPGNNESTNQTPLANNELNEDKTEILNTNQDHNNSIINNPADLALEDNAVPEGNELNEENNIVAQTEDRSDMNNNVNPANSNHHDNNDVKLGISDTKSFSRFLITDA